MYLELPGDAQVQILIAPIGAHAVPETLAAAPVVPQPRRRRVLLKGALVLSLMAAAYLAGGYAASREGSLPPAHAQGLASDGEAAAAPVPEAGQVPPAFARQLRQPPAVTPAPGAPAAGAPAKNPFGLED